MAELIWDSYDYKVAEHYVPAFINGDDSGLDDQDVQNLLEFEKNAWQAANAAGFTIGHWSAEGDDEGDYGKCDVSGLFADRAELKLMVFKEKT